jgi:hypothetical protein
MTLFRFKHNRRILDVMEWLRMNDCVRWHWNSDPTSSVGFIIGISIHDDYVATMFKLRFGEWIFHE